MAANSLNSILNNPKYQQLVSQRSSLGRTLSLLMVVIYFGFILLVAFAPGLLGASLIGGVTTIGIVARTAGDRVRLRADRRLRKPRQRSLRHADPRDR